MTSLTLITVLVMLYGMLNQHGYGRALALGGATSAGAALAIGGIAVPTFYFVSIGVAVALGLALLGNGKLGLRERRPLPPGAILLLVFLGWSTFVTIVAPELFNGLSVLAPSGGPKALIAAFLTASNIAQIGYLLLGLCVVVFLARSPSAGPELIGIAAGATTLLSLWRYLHQEAGLPFPNGLFDNSPNLAFIETAPSGLQRFRGILSEPSALAASSLITVSYLLPRSFQLTGWRRAGALLVAAAAAYLGAISTSATFVVAGVAVALIAAITWFFGFIVRRTSLSVVVGVAACALIVASLWLLPAVASFVQSTVDAKVGSASFSQRSNADSVSYDILGRTYGVGVGLGSSRSSSFLPGLLSTTGLIGTVLFSAAVAGLIYRSATVREFRPVIWALVSLLALKLVAGPDLSDPSGILWISLGLLSGAALRPDARQPLLRTPMTRARAPVVPAAAVDP